MANRLSCQWYTGENEKISGAMQGKFSMARKKKSLSVNIGGVPVDINSGMIEAITNLPTGFVSKHPFVETDVAARVKGIDWFAYCGQPLSLDLSMDTQQVKSWPQAVSSCKKKAWTNAEAEASNQLTVWLHLNDNENYQKWNRMVRSHKKNVITPLIKKKIAPFQIKQRLDIELVYSVRWDILMALMENTYIRSGHSAFFHLELLTIYEAGHFPCGWQGDWPKGKLIVY